MNTKSIVERYGVYGVDKQMFIVEFLDFLKICGCDVPNGKEVKQKWDAKVKRESSAVRLRSPLNQHSKKENTMSVQEYKEYIYK